MKNYVRLACLLIVIFTISGCGPNQQEKLMQSFIDSRLEQIKQLSKESAIAYWNATTTGDEQEYEKYSDRELKLRQIFSNSDDFNQLKEWKESGVIKEPLLARQLELLYMGYLENQLDTLLLQQIVELETACEKKFNDFRGTINGKPVTSNDIEEILKSGKGEKERKDAWLASKQVGPEVAGDLINLIKIRNNAAKQLGFDNYHTMSLTTSEQSAAELDAILNELYELTNAPFAALKAELDSILAAGYGISPADLMPWHYHDPFFQETPLVYNLDLDAYYADKDVVELARLFYQGIGLPVETILEKSDLYERDKKNPHAYCIDIDREGDVRALCNVKNNERWMETMLHELGHGIYDKYQDPATPWLLRTPAHTFTTEAIAMFFGRLSRTGAWMQEMLGLTDEQRQEIDQVSGKYMQLKQLIFARWAMVMYFFEKELYANPDQDLNTLWWNMVEKYQFVKRPVDRTEPDWAAKIHFTIAPCYYHNYLLGELFASQLHHTLVGKVLKLDPAMDVSYVNQGAAGDYIKKMVFEPGSKYRWDKMITLATGEPLTAKYFVQDFIR
ncbi:MAG TPA: M2 family metallopeptidase [bacterium]|nr:M2 family metallopeptidase [bacterium]HPN45124.1 M2 family metallopeptidase [bacterium]